MEITLTPSQFVSLKRLEIDIPVDTRDEQRDIRNIPAHITALESILGKAAVNEALATGEPITIHVDWSRGKQPARVLTHDINYSARVLSHESDLNPGEIMSHCWKCFSLCAFNGCHTNTRHPSQGGQTIIFEVDGYYAACPKCGAIQMEPVPPRKS